MLRSLGQHSLTRLVGLLLAVLTLQGLPNTVQAQPAAPRFDIQRFEVQGNTLLAAEAVEQTLAPFRGGNREFADIQRALESLEQAYRDRGYGVVQVSLPEQDITQGVVRLRVVEARIGRIIVEGNTILSAAACLR